MMKKRKKGVDVAAVAAKLAEEMGYELVDAAFEKEGPGVYLRIYLDKEGGISLSDCEAFHHQIQPKVEDAPYDFLEVCSPGIDRPIKTRRDAEKAQGELVELKLYKPLNGQKTMTGTLLGMDETNYLLDVGGEQLEIPIKATAVAKRVINMDEVLLAEQADTEEVQ